ncbi:hypothetical protein ACVPOY_02840 [Staphylococcus aureus]
MRLDLIGATGTAILLTVIITILITKLKWKSAGALLVEAIKNYGYRSLQFQLS